MHVQATLWWRALALGVGQLNYTAKPGPDGRHPASMLAGLEAKSVAVVRIPAPTEPLASRVWF